MTKTRLEAFSDGVIAILITIMVLELKPPHEATWEAVLTILPTFTSYIMSFLFLAIYWNNHHHLFHTVKHVDGRILWANMNLLFWLSLVPFLTAWVGESHFEPLSTSLYGLDLLFAGASYLILQNAIVRSHGKDSVLASALGRDWKGLFSFVGYATGTAVAWVSPLASQIIYWTIALVWFVPDRRIEKKLKSG